VTGTVTERLDQPTEPAMDEDDLEGGESEFAAGPISIAVDLSPAHSADELLAPSEAPAPP
jgi:hypothetical protein